jgi:hypothetical protein
MKETVCEDLKLKFYDEMLDLQTIAKHTPKSFKPKVELTDFFGTQMSN